MAKKTVDRAAAKAKKQKLVLAVAGVALLGLAAMQGPKLMKQLHPSTSAPSASPSSPSVPGPSTAVPGAPAAPRSSAAAGSGPTAVLAGVALRASAAPAPVQGQLTSFELFTPKDPFVQQASDTTAGQAPPPGTTPAPSSKPAGGAAGAGGSKAAPSVVAAPPPPPTDATISVNGTDEAVAVTKPPQTFPKSDPVFVLVSLKAKSATIGIADGTLTDRPTVQLKMGKPLTLVNSATGARYALKLLYTGATPEQVVGFTQAAK